MKKITRTALLPYSAESIYRLVNEVDAYPEFLPWCGGSEILDASDDEMTASVTIAKAGLHHAFITKNKLTPPESIEMDLVDGPFSHLSGIWHFKSLDENACKISFELEFEISNSLLNLALGPVFEQIASTMVQSFCDRAKQVYG